MVNAKSANQTEKTRVRSTGQTRSTQASKLIGLVNEYQLIKSGLKKKIEVDRLALHGGQQMFMLI